MTRSFSTHRQTPPKPRRTFRPQAEGLEGRQLLSAGALDTTFNSTGYALPGPATADAVQIDSSGNILAAGYTGGSNSDFRVVRLTPTGALDSSFGTNGSVTTDFAGQYDAANDMALQANGQIVVAGIATHLDAVTVNHKTVYYQDRDFGLVRYNPNGTLDTSFGNGGQVTTNISTYTGSGSVNYKEDDAYAVAIQDDGNIIVGGKSFIGASQTEGVLARYLGAPTTINGVTYAAGSLDPTFGTGGILQISVPTFSSDGVWDVQILRDPNPANDKIVTMEAPSTLDPSGNRHWSVSVARYNLNGTPDITFATNGRTTTTMSGQIYVWGMALASDGSVVVGGYYDYQNGSPTPLALFHYTTAGALDSTFGSGGVALYNDPSGASDVGYSVALQPSDGKILVAGYSSTPSSMSTILARFQSNGAIDTSFGTNGIASNTFNANPGSYLKDVILQPDGKSVAVGSASTTTGKTTTPNFLIARFLGDSATPSATASPAILTQPTSLGSGGVGVLIPQAFGSDQDLGQLAIDLIRSGTKRSRPAARPVTWLDDQRFW
jgi:uncharacterized delta-60 repeat protein